MRTAKEPIIEITIISTTPPSDNLCKYLQSFHQHPEITVQIKKKLKITRTLNLCQKIILIIIVMYIIGFELINPNGTE